MGISRIIIAGCVAVFIMFFAILFISERFLNLGNLLEKTCQAENDKFGMEKSKCQLNLMISNTMVYLFTFIIACFIGITGYLMIKNYRSVSEV